MVHASYCQHDSTYPTETLRLTQSQSLIRSESVPYPNSTMKLVNGSPLQKNKFQNQHLETTILSFHQKSSPVMASQHPKNQLLLMCFCFSSTARPVRGPTLAHRDIRSATLCLTKFTDYVNMQQERSSNPTRCDNDMLICPDSMNVAS